MDLHKSCWTQASQVFNFSCLGEVGSAHAVITENYHINRFVAFSRLETSASMTRQWRGGCQPGATPWGRVRVDVPPRKGGGILRPCRAEQLIPKTQGVALGWHTSALSGPKPGLCKSEFTCTDVDCSLDELARLNSLPRSS